MPSETDPDPTSEPLGPAPDDAAGFDAWARQGYDTWQRALVMGEAGRRWADAERPAADRLLAEFPVFDAKFALNEHGEVGQKAVVERIRGIGPSYAALDDLIDVAAKADIHVILDLIHVRTPDGPCTADHRLAGAKWNVPAWAWEEVTGVAQDDDCKARPNELGDLMDEVLVLPETTRFIRTILKRYDASTARGRNVVAVEPVSEAEASGDETGSATSRTQRLIDAVYTRWLASEGQASLRSANSTKILILSPDKGDASLQGVNLAPIALPNVVWSHHDYTLAVIAGSAAGQGYTEDGWASSQMQDRSEVRRPGRPTYDPDLVSFGRRLTERRGYLAQMQHWAAAGGLPIFVGEYGILTTCAPDGNLATAQAYAKASQELYDGALVEGGAAPVSRTWWQLSIGGTFGGEFALLAIDGRTCPGIDDAGWMPAAFDLTAGRIR